MKSNKEMSAMVQLLERLRDAMPRVNFFGESNVNRTNAQIDGIKIILYAKKPSEAYEKTLKSLSPNLDEDCDSERLEGMDWAMGNLCEDPTTEKEVLSWESKKPAPECRCGHGKDSHGGVTGHCFHESGCECASFKPAPPGLEKNEKEGE